MTNAEASAAAQPGSERSRQRGLASGRPTLAAVRELPADGRAGQPHALAAVPGVTSVAGVPATGSPEHSAAHPAEPVAAAPVPTSGPDPRFASAAGPQAGTVQPGGVQSGQRSPEQRRRRWRRANRSPECVPARHFPLPVDPPRLPAPVPPAGCRTAARRRCLPGAAACRHAEPLLGSVQRLNRGAAAPPGPGTTGTAQESLPVQTVAPATAATPAVPTAAALASRAGTAAPASPALASAPSAAVAGPAAAARRRSLPALLSRPQRSPRAAGPVPAPIHPGGRSRRCTGCCTRAGSRRRARRSRKRCRRAAGQPADVVRRCRAATRSPSGCPSRAPRSSRSWRSRSSPSPGHRRDSTS